MRFHPFHALLPPPAWADALACVPYDTVNTAEAARLAAGNPNSFLHVTRAEIDLPPETDPHADAVYAQAVTAWERLLKEGILARAPKAAYYVYRITKGTHAQTGVVGCCHVADYAANVIRRHEKTRPDKENDRLRHILAIRAHSGPVFLTYRDQPEIDRLVAAVTDRPPLLTAGGEDGTTHTLWPVPTPNNAAWEAAFAHVPLGYVADGHHRAAASVRAAAAMAEAQQQAGADVGDAAEWNRFLGVLFPASQLRILPYNRLVRDLNGLREEDFLKQVHEVFAVKRDVGPAPSGARRVHMYLGDRWYGLSWGEFSADDPVAALDVSVLQDRLLGPVLGIDDPRTSDRIAFVGGIRGTEALEAAVRDGEAAVAFAMFPVSVQDMIRIADADCIMPPKSTWFEPKLRSGLVVHPF